MSDWIEKLKREEARKREYQLAEEQIRMRKQDLVRSKLGLFLQDLHEEVRRQVEQLREAFPNDPKFHLQFTSDPPVFLVSNSTLPMRTLTLQSDETRTLLRVVERTRHAQMSLAEGETKTDVALLLGQQDELMWHLFGNVLSRPDQVAELLLKRLLLSR